MELINALPGNSSVNTVQYATTEEAVFRVCSDVMQRWGGGQVTCVSYDACPFLGYISDTIHSVHR
jgi:hypothetical protein